jgi:hypothetical protein
MTQHTRKRALRLVDYVAILYCVPPTLSVNESGPTPIVMHGGEFGPLNSRDAFRACPRNLAMVGSIRDDRCKFEDLPPVHEKLI